MPLWSSFNRQWSKWKQLERWEQLFLAQMCVLLPLTWLGLRVLGFRKMLEIAHADTYTTTPDPRILVRARRKAELTRIAANFCLHDGSCLPQALALCWRLRREGGQASVIIGADKKSRDFSAHAWVELSGSSLDQPSDKFAVIFS